jgi:LPS-assembly protein
MLRRLFLFFLPALSLHVSFANDASWNCQQSKDDKEWVCVGDKKAADKSISVKSQAKPELTPKSQAIPVDTVSTPPPAPPVKPIEMATPAKPKAAEVNQKVKTELKKAPKPEITASRKQLPTNAQPVARDSAPPGWTCGAKGKEEGWDCKLVGADPKGQPQLVNNYDRRFSLLEPAFDHRQEQIFTTLTSQLKHDPWENCTVELDSDSKFIPGKDLRTTSPLDVKSDYSEIFDNEIGTYYGNVEMNRADQHSSSHTANYDAISETLDLQGGVYYSEDELALYSETASLKLASDQAKLRDTLFISPSTPIRGRANVVYRDNKSLSRYKQVAYTSCKPGNQDWVMHASELKINKSTGKGAAKHAWLEAKGLPVFYFPYVSFPIDNRRLTGFLAPSYHYTQTGGFSLAAPYYWNIAPNYDATLNPKYFEKRGILLGANFRYLFEKTKGNVAFEFLPHDSLRNQARYLGSFKNNTVLTPNISSNVDLNYVSDKNYFSELGNALSFTNFSYIKSSADVNYIREGASLIGRFDYYQSVDPTISGIRLPYKRLPQVNLNLNHSFKFMPLETTVESEYVHFQHNTLVDGQRMNVKPSISFPLQTASAFLTPKMSWQYTRYDLNNLKDTGYAPGTSNVGSASTISRSLPIFSVDSGVFFERDVNLFKTALTHTLEPRLFYLYIPYKDQSNIPTFDSSLYDFWFNSLFRENRFSGSDRIQDANQLSAAVTSRLIDPVSGQERLRLNLGGIAYFRDRQVTAPIVVNGVLTPTPVETNSFSNLVAEMGSEINRHVSVETGIQWNPHENDVERGKAVLHLTNQPNELFNIGYLYRKNPLIPNRANDIIQSDVSFRWPVYDDWYAVGRWQYSLLYNRTQESFLGLEKENCCWRFRIIGRHFVNGLINTAITNTSAQTVQGTSQTGIFLQIELKSLTGLGQKLDDFFEQNISGYRKSEK